MSKIGNQLTELIKQKKQLVTNLNVKGVSADESETLNTLVPKVLTVVGNSDVKLGIKEVTEDGEYFAYQDEVDGYSSINVNTSQDFNFSIKITNDNGIYYKIKALSDIPDNAFIYINNIKEVDLNKSKRIGYSALYYKATLQKIVAINPLIVDGHAFYDCSSAEGEITISEEQISIKDYTFSNCSKLKVNLHNNIISIGRSAFQECNAIDWIELPKQLKDIAVRAFYKCTNLKISEIPENVETILTDSFYYCSSIETLKIHDKCKTISSRAFQYCSKLKELELGKGINNISSYAFSACGSLEEIIIHATTPPVIQSNTFNGSNSISKIKVPLSVLENYKNASNWSNYADIMIGIEGE